MNAGSEKNQQLFAFAAAFMFLKFPKVPKKKAKKHAAAQIYVYGKLACAVFALPRVQTQQTF